MELVRPIVPIRERSPLATARIQRRLTVEEAARRAGLAPDQVTWLEEGRVYRFPSSDDALCATLLLAGALEIGNREARQLAGLPVPPGPLGVNPAARLAVVAALSVLLTALVAFVLVPGVHGPAAKGDPLLAQAAALPEPWRISVDVLNGSGDINWTRRQASRIQSLAYTVKHVGRADRFDYTQTAVFYERGGRPIAVRLARQLGVVTRPLPGGTNARRLVVVVGPQRGPG